MGQSQNIALKGIEVCRKTCLVAEIYPQDCVLLNQVLSGQALCPFRHEDHRVQRSEPPLKPPIIAHGDLDHANTVSRAKC